MCFFYSCFETDCKSLEKTIANEECNIIVKYAPSNSVWFEIQGYDPLTHEPKLCKTNNRWWNMYAMEIDEGDTVVKKRGEITFNIYKKDTVIVHKWDCGKFSKK